MGKIGPGCQEALLKESVIGGKRKKERKKKNKKERKEENMESQGDKEIKTKLEWEYGKSELIQD